MYLPIYLSINLSINLSIYASIYPSMYPSMYPSIYLFIYLCIHLYDHLCMYLSIYLLIYLTIYLFIYLSIYLSMYPSMENHENLIFFYFTFCLFLNFSCNIFLFHLLYFHQFSMAHAHLELNVNCSPLIALKVLNVARASSPSAAYDVRFVCMLCHVLTIIGDLKQIRWIFQTILSEPAVISPPVVLVPGAPNLITSGLSEITSSFGEKSFKSIRSLSGTGE